MKHAITVILGIFSFISPTLGTSYEYIPMESITDWQVKVSGLGGSGTYWYSYSGDTIINNEEYRIISYPLGTNYTGELYLRDDIDNKTVYRYLPQQNFEYIYYDFGLEENAVFYVYNGSNFYEYLVDEIDTIQAAIGPLKRWKFKKESGGFGFSYIETIGGHPLEYEMPIFYSDPVYSTQCVYKICELYYGDAECSHPRRFEQIDSLEITLCSGETFMNHDSTGIYRDTLVSALGCDSIIISDIQVDSLPILTKLDTICQGEESYGISEAGTYEIILPSEMNCDTVLTLSLTVLQTETDSLMITLCSGESFLGHDSTGIYTDTLVNSVGCDSIIISDILVESLPVLMIYDTICPEEESYGFMEEGIYELILPSEVGCDTLLTLSLTVLEADDSNCMTSINTFQNYKISVYPNPFSDKLSILTDHTSLKYQIYDFYGNLLVSDSLSEHDLNVIDLGNLRPGMYMIRFNDGLESKTQKILKL